MSAPTTENDQQRCPRDGQTAEWHLHVAGTHPSGSPRTNGEFVGCPFGSETPAEKDSVRRLLLRRWRRLFCCNVDCIWGHLCEDGEGCQR